MSEYNHYISGFFANRDDAESTFSILVERGLPRDRLRIFKTVRHLPTQRLKRTATRY